MRRPQHRIIIFIHDEDALDKFRRACSGEQTIVGNTDIFGVHLFHAALTPRGKEFWKYTSDSGIRHHGHESSANSKENVQTKIHIYKDYQVRNRLNADTI